MGVGHSKAENCFFYFSFGGYLSNLNFNGNQISFKHKIYDNARLEGKLYQPSKGECKRNNKQNPIYVMHSGEKYRYSQDSQTLSLTFFTKPDKSRKASFNFERAIADVDLIEKARTLGGVFGLANARISKIRLIDNYIEYMKSTDRSYLSKNAGTHANENQTIPNDLTGGFLLSYAYSCMFKSSTLQYYGVTFQCGVGSDGPSGGDTVLSKNFQRAIGSIRDGVLHRTHWVADSENICQPFATKSQLVLIPYPEEKAWLALPNYGACQRLNINRKICLQPKCFKYVSYSKDVFDNGFIVMPQDGAVHSRNVLEQDMRVWLETER